MVKNGIITAGDEMERLQSMVLLSRLALSPPILIRGTKRAFVENEC